MRPCQGRSRGFKSRLPLQISCALPSGRAFLCTRFRTCFRPFLSIRPRNSPCTFFACGSDSPAAASHKCNSIFQVHAVIPFVFCCGDGLGDEPVALLRHDCCFTTLLTITNTKPPATDLGYLLHKNPNRVQSFELSFGKVFYPEATYDHGDSFRIQRI